MRKFLTILTLSLVCALCAIGLSACDNFDNSIVDDKKQQEQTIDDKERQEQAGDNKKENDGELKEENTKLKSGIVFKTMEVDGNNARITIPNAQTEFDFFEEIESKGNATYSVSKNVSGSNPIESKTVEPTTGENKYYILVKVNGELESKYIVTIYRKHIFIVSFNTSGGTLVSSQQVEEGSFATEPTTKRMGYTFVDWSYDFNEPVNSSFTVTASWVANTDTQYKVEYYLQNLEDDNYTLQEKDTEIFTGTTDSIINKTIYKTYQHYVIKDNLVSDTIRSDGSTILKVYYDLETFTVSILATSGIILDSTYNGIYKYGYNIPDIIATCNSQGGYEWKGWYSSNNLIFSNNVIKSFKVHSDIEYTAISELNKENAIFNFQTTDTTCEITGIKDKTVKEIIIPEYVTSIREKVFQNCNLLEKLTISENVTSIGDSAFSSCMSLERVNWNAINCQTAGSFNYPIFNNCTKLTILSVGKNVKNFPDNTFRFCSNISTIYYAGTISEWASQINGLSNLMYNTSKYKSLVIDNKTLSSDVVIDGIQSISGGAFRGTGIRSVIIGESVKWIGWYAFADCSVLQSITFGNNVSSIGTEAFDGCGSLTSITITRGIYSIGQHAFRNCSLHSAIFENPEQWNVNNTPVQSYFLTSESIAARYLRETYEAYLWKRGGTGGGY